MAGLAALFEAMHAAPDAPVSVDGTWMQGRTAYGGLSTVLAHEAALVAYADLPPLASGQVAFIGPLAGALSFKVDLLRRGRNVAFVQVDVSSPGTDGTAQLGLRANFVFSADRESRIEEIAAPRQDLPLIPDACDLRRGPEQFFTHHMEYAAKRVMGDGSRAKVESWMRLAERDGIDRVRQLLFMGDAMPPAAMALIQAQAPISSINWQFNLLGDVPPADGDFWYMESAAHYTAHGASSQFMEVRGLDGRLAMTGMQAVALFV